MNTFERKMAFGLATVLVSFPLLTAGSWLLESGDLRGAVGMGAAAREKMVQISQEEYAPPAPETPFPETLPLDPSWDLHRGELHFLLLEP